jgi:hypothetical protein
MNSNNIQGAMMSSNIRWRRRGAEFLAISMIGDGVLAFIDPRHHLRLWQKGPKPWEEAVEPFVQHTGWTRALAVVEIGLGIWLAGRQWNGTAVSRTDHHPPPAYPS